MSGKLEGWVLQDLISLVEQSGSKLGYRLSLLKTNCGTLSDQVISDYSNVVMNRHVQFGNLSGLRKDCNGKWYFLAFL